MPHRASGDGAGPYRILLVDDNEEILRTLALLLARQGHDVRTTTTVAAAVEMAGDPFDLVICDLSLPDGSGLDLMRELKKRCAMKGIAFSGLTSQVELDQVKAAGFERCLAKPISFDDLSRVMREVMDEP